MSCGVSGPSSTTRARRQCRGTCAAVSILLGWARTRSLRRWPHHVYVCSNVSVSLVATRCSSWPRNTDMSASLLPAASRDSSLSGRLPMSATPLLSASNEIGRVARHAHPLCHASLQLLDQQRIHVLTCDDTCSHAQGACHGCCIGDCATLQERSAVISRKY
jgi:hypothetical protein